jgi:ankyrin repeat protein
MNKQDEIRKQLEQMNIEFTETAFIECVKQGKVEVVKLFLSAGMDSNLDYPKGYVALLEELSGDIIMYEDPEYAMPPTLTEETEKNVTPLMWAAMYNQIKVAEVLINNSAQVDAQDKIGSTALHIAAAKGFSELVQLLIVHGATVGIKDSVGYTPLAWAVCRGHIVFFQIASFSGRGSEKAKDNLTDTQKDNFENLPKDNLKNISLDRVVGKEHFETVKCLLVNGANLNEINLLFKAVKAIQLEMAKFLIDLGLDIHERDYHGETLLTTAVRTWNPEMVKLILEQGADVNEQDTDGKTALISASWISAIKPAEVLIQNGAKFDLRDNESKTALDWAEELGHEKFVQLLKTAGAKE